MIRLRSRTAAMLMTALVIAGPRLFGQVASARDGLPDEWRANLNRQLDRDIADLGRSPVADARTPSDQQVTLHMDSRLRGNDLERGAALPSTFTPAAILRQQGLPASLTAVAQVESGFNPLALSPKGARGLWQLMPETARRFGLTVDGRRDERLDPRKSTLAAAQYLKVLFAQFHDWPLALAAYNSGEDRVQRSLDRLGAHDFWTLSRHAALPEETRRYVPAVLKALEGRSPAADAQNGNIVGEPSGLPFVATRP